MIFSEGFDKTLYFILENDKKNKNKIISFLNKIPKELIEKIHIVIEECKKNGLMHNDCFLHPFDYYDEVIVNNNEVYSFNYSNKGMGFELDLTYWIIDENEKKEGFNLNLLNFDDIMFINNFDDEEIGSLEYNFSHKKIDDDVSLMDTNETIYQLFKTPGGYFALCKHEDDKLFKFGMSFKSEKNLLNNLNLDNKVMIRKLK